MLPWGGTRVLGPESTEFCLKGCCVPWLLCYPKGPCAQIVCALALK